MYQILTFKFLTHVQDVVKHDINLFYKHMTNLLQTFKPRMSHAVQPCYGAWSSHSIGKYYNVLYPHTEFKQFGNRSVGTEGRMSKYKIKKDIIPAQSEIYGQGLFTANYYTPYHIDKKDGFGLSHCAYSIPPSWKAHPESCSAVFCLGSSVFDISKFNLQVSLMPKHSYHGTGIPKYVPEVPEALLKDKGFDTVKK